MSETGMPFLSNGVKTGLKPVSKRFENGVKTCSVNTPFQNGVKTRLKPVSKPFIVRKWHARMSLSDIAACLLSWEG